MDLMGDQKGVGLTEYEGFQVREEMDQKGVDDWL